MRSGEGTLLQVSDEAIHDPESALDATAGLAHVATASFVASRVVPTGGFAVALAGGVALARTAERRGARIGYGASFAAMLHSVAVLGPARLGVPLTQALSAPLLGRLQARGRGLVTQIAACAGIRLLDQTVATAFFIFVIVGGLEAYAGTYDAFLSLVPALPDGAAAALVATALGLVTWTAFASTVQVHVYRRGLRGWPSVASDDRLAPGLASSDAGSAASGRPGRPRFDPRVVALSAAIAFCALVVSTAWPLLAAVTAWLTVAWSTARADRAPVRAGLALAALLGGGALAFGLLGGIELDLTLRRTARAALLVLVATWLRAAAGETGLREVARRSLWRLRRLPAVPEAARLLDRLGSGAGLSASGRALVRSVRPARRRPGPLAAAVLRWIAQESRRFESPAPGGAVRLGARAVDAVLLAGSVGAAATLTVGAG